MLCPIPPAVKPNSSQCPRLTLHCSVDHFPTRSSLADSAVALLSPLLSPKTCSPCSCPRAFAPTMTSAWNVPPCSASSLTLGQTSQPHNLKFQILATRDFSLCNLVPKAHTYFLTFCLSPAQPGFGKWHPSRNNRDLGTEDLPTVTG